MTKKTIELAELLQAQRKNIEEVDRHNNERLWRCNGHGQLVRTEIAPRFYQVLTQKNYKA
jgi:hypothetical protein